MGYLDGDLRYPGHGYPERPDPRAPQAPDTAWGRLAAGQPLGKRAVAQYLNTESKSQPSPVSILQVQGRDADALNLTVTLSPPLVIPQALAQLPTDLQAASGEIGNAELLAAGNFPGTGFPFVWAPVHYELTWGIGGASEQVDVDAINGCTVNLCASFLRVRAVIESELGGTSAAYVLSAFVGPGWTRPGSAQRTIFDDVPAGLETTTHEVPRFAKRVTLFSCDSGASPELTDLTLRFWRRADKSLNNLGNVLVTGNQPPTFHVPNGAAYFSILSGMAADHLVGAIFDLSI